MFLIVGGNSEIGAATAGFLGARGRDVLATTRRPEEAGPQRPLLDLAAPLGAFSPPPDTTAAAIFVAVARLAACARDPQGARLINCERTLDLARHLCEAGVYTLYLSTNQVFDGRQPHVPADASPCPVSEYGRQKAETEAGLKAMMADGAPVGILRLSKVASPGMALIAGWRRDLAAGHPIRAFVDMTMAPVPTALVAEAIGGMMEDRAPVVAQLTGPRDLSYFEIARQIARQMGADEGLVEAASALDHGQPVGATPANTTLDSAYLHVRYGIEVPDVASVVEGL